MHLKVILEGGLKFSGNKYFCLRKMGEINKWPQGMVNILRWLGKDFFFFFFVFPTFHFRFPDFTLPFSRLFTSVFPTFHFQPP